MGCLPVLGVSQANADVIYGSLDTPLGNPVAPPVTGSSAAAFGPTSPAFQFTPLQNYNVTSVIVPSASYSDVADYRNPPPTVPTFSVSLFTGTIQGSLEIPGSSLGSVTNISTTNPVADFSSQSVSLAAGENYWLVLAPVAPDSGVWTLQTTAAASHYANANKATGGNWERLPDMRVAFEVIGTPAAAAATPEPATFLLAAPAIVGLWFVRRKKVNHTISD